MKRLFLILIFFLLFNLLFFHKLFYPNQQLIITPEFGGGDTVNIQIPFKKVLCEKIKSGDLPFWIKKMSLGYPLLAEGEIGALNPINLLTCRLFEYKTAFNLQIILHNLLGNFGLFLLGRELGFSFWGSLYLALVFPYLPLVTMNYMQISLVYPLFYFPFMMVGLLRLFKNEIFSGFLWISLAVFFQFLTAHYQISFISFISSFIFLIVYFFLLRKDYSSKKLILLITIFISSWLVGGLLAAVQTLPGFQFSQNSNRTSFTFPSFASSYDQNFTLENFLTVFHPYINGDPKNGSYSFGKIAHPWEGNIFIFYLPLVFLIFSFFKVRKKIYLASLITFFLIVLIAAGKNSPFYFIHGLPIFSAFRFPTRFLLLAAFYLVLLSSFGFEDFIKNKHKLIFFICVSVVFFESYRFFYHFHVLYPSSQMYKNSLVYDFFQRNKLLDARIYLLGFDNLLIDKKYVNEGYKSNETYFYNYLNNLLLPNVNLIYNLTSFSEKTGPLLTRKSLFYSDFYLGEVDMEAKKASLSARVINKLKLSGIDYIVSSFEIVNEKSSLKKLTTLKNNQSDYKINVYQLLGANPLIKFYDKIFYIETLGDFDAFINDKKNLDRVVIDFNSGVDLKENKTVLKASYKVIKDDDHHLLLETITNKEAILVVAENFYPEWQAYIDRKKVPLFKANFLYQGIKIPPGSHQVEFRYVPKSFYYGLVITSLSFLMIFLAIFFQQRSPPFFSAQ